MLLNSVRDGLSDQNPWYSEHVLLCETQAGICVNVNTTEAPRSHPYIGKKIQLDLLLNCLKCNI